MQKLSAYVSKYTNQVKNTPNQNDLLPMYRYAAQFYSSKGGRSDGKSSGRRKKTTGSSGKAHELHRQPQRKEKT